jgi:hypothetical protein
VTTELSTTTWPTRELILLEASRLFAVRGYCGTSTRRPTAVAAQWLRSVDGERERG